MDTCGPSAVSLGPVWNTLVSAHFSTGLTAFFLLIDEVLFIFYIASLFYHRLSLHQGDIFVLSRGIFMLMESHWLGLPHMARLLGLMDMDILSLSPELAAAALRSTVPLECAADVGCRQSPPSHHPFCSSLHIQLC